MKEQKNFWDRNAGRYDRFMRKDQAAYEEMYALIRPVVKAKTVLELATGTGLIAKHIAEEAELALSEAAVMAHNPTIGYESSNHYFYTRQTLLEKVLNCRYLLKKHGYESVPERF